MCPFPLCGRGKKSAHFLGRFLFRGHITLANPRDDLLRLAFRKEIVVLNRYFIRPTTVDRIRTSWIGEAIERYVVWLAEQNYAARNVSFRVPVLVRFGEFA